MNAAMHPAPQLLHKQLLLDFNHHFDSLEQCSNGAPFFTGYALGLVYGKEGAAGKTFWDDLHNRISMELGFAQPFANLYPLLVHFPASVALAFPGYRTEV
jgi:hypothetical protein